LNDLRIKYSAYIAHVIIFLSNANAMHKRGQCRRVVFVCPDTFVYCVRTAKDTAIVAMECKYETTPKVPSFRTVPFSMTFSDL